MATKVNLITPEVQPATTADAAHVQERRLNHALIVQEPLCESRGGRPALSVLTSLLVSVDVKLY